MQLRLHKCGYQKDWRGLPDGHAQSAYEIAVFGMLMELPHFQRGLDLAPPLPVQGFQPCLPKLLYFRSDNGFAADGLHGQYWLRRDAPQNSKGQPS